MRNRSAILGYAVLTLILTAGAAQGLAGTNTVTSDDIVNESLTSADVKNEALTSSDIRNESLTGSDIRNGSLTGSDVAGFRKVHFAHVDKDGDRIRGDATGADQIATGRYEVRFAGFDVRSCVWSGSEADFIGGSALTANRVISIDTDDDTDEVTVYATSLDTRVRADASFALIGVCP